MGHAQRGCVAEAAGVADLDEACRRIFGNTEGQTRGAAHQHLGGLAVYEHAGQHGGRTNRRPQICAGQLDLAARQRGGGQNVVDARRREGP
jgi:hypothetical protein